MSVIEMLMEEVQNAKALDGQAKQTVVAFLTTNRTVLERLSAEAAKGFFEVLYLNGPSKAWDELVAHLGQQELLALLRQTQGEMDQAIDHRAAAVAQWQEFTNALGVTALRLLTRVVLAAI